jgi:ElaA protein
MQLNWAFKKFDGLSSAEIYSIMQLRNEVFVVEQNCVYQDADDKDRREFPIPKPALAGW